MTPGGLDETCARCQGSIQVTYCPAWDEYLCADCRMIRSDSETRVSLEAKQAMQAAAEVQP